MAEKTEKKKRPRGPGGKWLTNAQIAEMEAAGVVFEDEPLVEEPKPSGDRVRSAAEPDGHEDFSRDANGRLLSTRERVRRAQLRVLNRVENILDGNCESAKQGNYNSAKFVLDWSGVSDIRTPLAKPIKKKSALQALLKKFREEDLGPEDGDKNGE